MAAKTDQRRSCPPPRLSRRESLVRLAKALTSARVASGVISGVVVSVINKTWLTPPLSGVTHRVDAGGISISFRLSQPTVTVVRAPVVWRA